MLVASALAVSAVLAPLSASAQSGPGPGPGPGPAPAPTPAPAPSKDRLAHALAGLSEPKWGNIRTFWGDNGPFWGDTRPFWGEVSPYEGSLKDFWGKIRTLNVSSTSAITPLWGNIRTFSGDLGASWGNIRTFWGNIRTFEEAPGDYVTLAGQLNEMYAQSQSFWGTAVLAQTGKSFDAAFANPLFAKYGINLSDPGSLAKLDADAREHFFFDWYDGLMNYSGADHIDHWMKEANWTPYLTQYLGSGRKTVIGLLDFTVTGAETANITKYSGISDFANGHGSAVASLMISAHDGKGVMGIAPGASVVAYNPFDATQSAGWADITTGVTMLAQNKAGVINMSLGVPGWTLNPGWNNVFADGKLYDILENTVFVVAAGNDGITQTESFKWDKHNPALIIVGSIDPTGTISTFSNRPGNACLLDKNECKGDYLKNHFIVAPGEMILVSDGAGGVTRMSGTSFAAPLVSGTISLIQSRWPWLTEHPNDTVNIIFKSARDLGAPGVDPVYGWGALDVEAALSPLDWNKLTVKQVVGGKIVSTSIADLRKTTAATRATWEPNGVYFSLFEDTGESYRDFQVPMSSKLTNQTVSVNGSMQLFMGYLTSRFSGWLGAPSKLTGGTGALGFTDLTGATQRLGSVGGIEASLTMRPRVNRLGFRSSEVPFQTDMRIVSPDRRFALQVGSGDGAGVVGGQNGFAMASDYDVEQGGANPFLGFASGGAYARVEAVVAPGLTLSSGISQRELRRSLSGVPIDQRAAWNGMDPYRAQAGNLTVNYAVSPALSTSFGYTVLREDKAILGMASSSASDLPDGSTTDAATFGANLAVTPGFSLAASATLGRTRAGDPARSNIAVGQGGMLSSSFQVAMTKDRVLDGNDHLRLTLAQPMHIEHGSVDITNVEILDRETGELGAVTRNVAVSRPARRYVAEMIYGHGLFGGKADFSLFGRANLGTQATDQIPAYMGGGTIRIGF
ncbi:MAG: S8 family serine peptidase [Pseudomonadota bacterium]